MSIPNTAQTNVSEEERLRNFFLQAPAAIVVLEGPQHVITLANRVFQEILGRKNVNLVGVPFIEQFPELNGQGVLEILDEVYHTGKTFHGRSFPAVLSKDGVMTQQYFDFILQALRNEAGEILGLMGHAVDVTEQVVARRQLEEKEADLVRIQQQLQLSLHAGGIGLWHWNIRENLLTWSKEQYEIFGIQPQDFKGTAEEFFKLVLPEDRDKIKAASRLEFEKSENEYQFRIRRHDGSIRWIQSRSKTLPDRMGNPEYITGVNIDITKEKEIEERLRQSEEFSRSILQSSPECYKILDREGRLQFMNDHGKTLMDLDDFDTIRNRYWWDLYEPEFHETVYNAFADALSGKISKFQAYSKTAKGRGRWWDVVISVIGDQTSHGKRLLAVSRDITEQKIISEKIRQSEEKFRLLSASLEQKVNERTEELRELNEQLERKNDELSNSRSFLQQLIDSSVESISVVDRALNYITVNKSFEQVYNVKGSDLAGKPMLDVNPLLARSEKLAGIRKAFGGETVYLEKRPSVSNPELFLDTHFIPLLVGDKVEGVIIMSRDVTKMVQSERELENKNRLLNEAQQMAKLGSWEWDFGDDKLHWSEQMYRIYGYEEVFPITLEKAVERMLPEDQVKSRERIRELYRRLPELFQHSVNLKYYHTPSDYTIQLPDGERRFLRGITQLVFFPGGKLNKIVGTVQDITEQKHHEEELYRVNRELNEAQQTAQMGNFEWDPVHNTLKWSDNMYRIHGLPVTETINFEKFIHLIHPRDRDNVQQVIKTIIETKTFIPFYHRYLMSNGKSKILYSKGEVVMDNEGKVVKIKGTGQDVTRQRLIEKKLIRANHKLTERNRFVETLLHSSLYVIMVIDNDMRVLTMNNKAEMLFSTNFEPPFIGRKLNEIHPGIEDTVAYKDLLEAFKGKLVIRDKLKSSFSEHYFEHNFIPLFNETNQVYAVMLMSHDITESIRQMEDLKRALEADEMKSDFIRMASHELKTPVTSIKGYIQLLLHMLEKADEAAIRRDFLYHTLEHVGKQVNRLTRLLTELLDLSRIELGQLSLTTELFDLNELVNDTSEDMKQSNPGYEVRVIHDIKAFVHGDRDRIGQVLINILSNAVKYSPKNKTIEVKITSPLPGRAEVSVKDYGIGIEKGEFEKIFNRFYRAAGKNEQTYPGFGIGLFIAKEIVERHGGRITVDSEKDKWTEFKVQLPATAQ